MWRFRRTSALASLCLAAGAMLMLYLVVDIISVGEDDMELQKIELNSLETKLKSLENDLLLNEKTIDKIKEAVRDMQKEQKVMREESKAIRAKGQGPVNKTFASIAKGDFTFAQTPPAQCDIRMSDVYDKLPFDNPDGGPWKQGWQVEYDKKEAKDPSNKLQVIIMPHTHCDPGWIKTFERYYTDQVRHILDNMLNYLPKDPKRKFTYAEVSFFSLWWNEQDLENRKKVLKLLENGQLEILTGGWVMNDEANTYYWAIIEQMVYGHEWLDLNLNGYKPNNGWAIDPFGLSSTMAYLLKRMGFDAMAIQRTHYSVKKHLARERDLEFKWRQTWDHEQTSDILTHMMPFYSYDVPHTCGPDPKICCQFDFERLPGGQSTCPWRVPPKEITQSNIGERTNTILDQWRKKASLYKTNVVLIPLGDDFRWTTSREWDKQLENYEQIIKYVDDNSDVLNAQVRFGTLEDYFQAVREVSERKTGNENGLFKTLSGDFFTYADRDDHYWSGYFTSRPFWKGMDRTLQNYLRSAEILYSMMWAEMEYVGSDIKELANGLMVGLIEARQNLALFQHHDGITGTAKDHVVKDYAERMAGSIEDLQTVIKQTAHYLLTPSKSFYKPRLNEVFFDLDDNREDAFSLPRRHLIQMETPEEAYRVVLFNSHARSRSEVVTVRVTESNVRVYRINNVEGDDEEENVPCQISPVFDDGQNQIMNTEYELSFLADVKGLALQTYYVKMQRPEEGVNSDMDVAAIRLLNQAEHPFQVPPFSNIEVFERGDSFTLQNGYVRAEFDPDGMLQKVTTLDDKRESQLRLKFMRYGTRNRGDKSGAYLFLPDGEAKPIPIEKPKVKVVQGKLLSYVEVRLPFCTHIVTLKTSPGVDGTGLLIDNLVDWRRADNQELVMRLETDLKSGDDFFTDLNGFQMARRETRTKLPLQANYYPMPSMAYLQDDDSRMTLIGKQPVGVASLQSGQLEVILERRLMQDDNRGLFQGVTDNMVTPNSFALLLERRTKDCVGEADDPQASYPSLLAISSRHALLAPYHRLIWTQSGAAAAPLSKNYEPMDKDMACDIHIVSLRTMQSNAFKQEPSDQSALIVHRQGFNGCYKPVGMTCSTNGGKISLESVFPELFGSGIKQMSLSLLYEGMKMEKGFTVSIKPMELYSFLLRR